MSSNNSLQTNTSSALHNAIMEAGGKYRPPMLAPGNYVRWKSQIKRYIDTKPNNELIHYCLENEPYKYQLIVNPEHATPGIDGALSRRSSRIMEFYVTVLEEIKKKMDAEAEAVQIILTGIDNDIYSIVDACPNAMEMFCKMLNDLVKNQCIVTNYQVNVQFLLQLKPEWQMFVNIVKQNQDLKNVSYHKLYDILKQHHNEVNKIRAKRLARNANPLTLVAATQQPVYHPQPKTTHYTQSSSTRSQAATRNKGKEIANTLSPKYDLEPEVVSDEEATPRDKEIEKFMALISMKNVGTQVVQQTGIQCFNCKEFGHVARECKKAKRDDTDDKPEDQELKAHYMYMPKIKEVIPDASDNSGPIFDTKPLAKVHNNNDDYNVFAIEKEYPEQPGSINNTYVMEKNNRNITPDSSDMSDHGREADQDDDLAKERDLLASLIEQMKLEIVENKKQNKCLESSNKAYKEANTFLANEIDRCQNELDMYQNMKCVKDAEFECAKACGLLVEQKVTSEKSFNAYTQKINELNQKPSKMEKEFFAH
ncbi:gag-pol polyprotein [Tanacetum coccineum]